MRHCILNLGAKKNQSISQFSQVTSKFVIYLNTHHQPFKKPSLQLNYLFNHLSLYSTHLSLHRRSVQIIRAERSKPKPILTSNCALENIYTPTSLRKVGYTRVRGERERERERERDMMSKLEKVKCRRKRIPTIYARESSG